VSRTLLLTSRRCPVIEVGRLRGGSEATIPTNVATAACSAVLSSQPIQFGSALRSMR
jgi:hypothetical protein